MPIGGAIESNNNGSASNWWNNNHPENDNYTLSLTGWVVEIHEVMSTYQGQVKWFDPNPDHPEWGQNPMLSWELVIKTDDGREVHFSEGKHKDIWKYVWMTFVMAGEPDQQDRVKKRSLPDMLQGARITISTEPKEKWKTQARPYRFQYLGVQDPSCFRGFFEDWKTDPRYTEDPRCKQAKQKTDEALQQLQQQNPELGAKIAAAYAASTQAQQPKTVADVYLADEDIPF